MKKDESSIIHKACKLGEIGEKIVLAHLLNQGHKIERSPNKFDSEKDFILDGNIKCEIKTQIPWIIRQSFAIRLNQINKLNNVDRIYFVAIPSKTMPAWFDSTIFMFDNKKNDIVKYTFDMVRSENRMMALIDVNQLTKVKKLNNKILNNYLIENSLTEWSA